MIQHACRCTCIMWLYSIHLLILRWQLMVFHWSLSGKKSLPVPKPLDSILTNLNNAVILIFPNPTVLLFILRWQCAPITIGINVTFIFHNFFDSVTKLYYSSFFSYYFNNIPCMFLTPVLTSRFHWILTEIKSSWDFRNISWI